MPRLIPDIDDYFEEKRKDLYLIKVKNSKAEKTLLKWFNKYLPNTEIGRIFPFRKDSGMIFSPAIGYFIEFDEVSLKAYCDKWEDENGQSLNSDFQCYICQLPDEYKK